MKLAIKHLQFECRKQLEIATGNSTYHWQHIMQSLNCSIDQGSTISSSYLNSTFVIKGYYIKDKPGMEFELVFEIFKKRSDCFLDITFLVTFCIVKHLVI